MNEVIFNKKVIGFIENDTYISHRTREHIFRKFENGFGISSKVIDFLESQNVNKVKIIFEDRHEFVCDLDLFYLRGFKYLDGEDEQMILPNKLFNKKIVTEVQTVI
jgi:hypothetical protein